MGLPGNLIGDWRTALVARRSRANQLTVTFGISTKRKADFIKGEAMSRLKLDESHSLNKYFVHIEIKSVTGAKFPLSQSGYRKARREIPGGGPAEFDQ